MYPRISDLINDIFGTDIVLPAKTFGLFLALAFIAAYLVLRKELLRLSHACGVEHPGLLTADHFELIESGKATTIQELYGYREGWGLPSEEDRDAIRRIMSGETAIQEPAAALPTAR